jgi:predicted DNA-binding ribbon-helix-helix protein
MPQNVVKMTRMSIRAESPGKRLADPGSTLVNRNVTVFGHRTSIRLEPAMWHALSEICAREHVSLHVAVSAIAEERTESSLTSAIRSYLLSYFQSAATEEGHCRAGHGAGMHRYRA